MSSDKEMDCSPPTMFKIACSALESFYTDYWNIQEEHHSPFTLKLQSTKIKQLWNTIGYSYDKIRSYFDSMENASVEHYHCAKTQRSASYDKYVRCLASINERLHNFRIAGASYPPSRLSNNSSNLKNIKSSNFVLRTPKLTIIPTMISETSNSDIAEHHLVKNTMIEVRPTASIISGNKIALEIDPSPDNIYTLPDVELTTPSSDTFGNIDLVIQPTFLTNTLYFEGRPTDSITYMHMDTDSMYSSSFDPTIRSSLNTESIISEKTCLKSPKIDYVKLLAEIANENQFEVTYVDIEEKTFTEQYQCLVQLSSLPVGVCHGSGPTPTDAQKMAAQNALEYLKIMTKK